MIVSVISDKRRITNEFCVGDNLLLLKAKNRKKPFLLVCFKSIDRILLIEKPYKFKKYKNICQRAYQDKG